MAEEQQANAKQDAAGEGGQGSKKNLLPWIILAAVVPISAGAGFGLARLLAGSSQGPSADHNQVAKVDVGRLLNKKADAEKSWYYQCEPLVANLNEPGANRYIRIVFTLELSGQLDQGKGRAYLDSKLPMIKNWLTIYFSSLALEDVQGQKNLNRIASQIRDGLNEQLFPESPALITNVYYSEWAIQ